MNTRFIKVERDSNDLTWTKDASEVLLSGGLVAFPTETVYGLGGNALDKTASQKIYAAKGRPSDNPLIVHISSFSQLENISKDLCKEAKILADAFWPGPLTMIVKKNEQVPYETTGGLDTVAVRMPSHPIARMLIEESGVMIAAPSANTSGRPSPTKASHVKDDLDGKIDMIIDGGEVDIGLESTIIDLSTDEFTVLRPGYITLEMIEDVLGRRVEIDRALVDSNSNIKPKAPGMKYRHYAPKAALTIVEGELDKVVATICDLSEAAVLKGQKVGIIATNQTFDSYGTGTVLNVGDRSDEEDIARHLFDILRQFDEYDIDVIYAESLSTPNLGQAIMNRLLKAAGHTVITV